MPQVPVYEGGEAAALEGRINPQSGAASRISTAGRMVGQLGREGAQYLETGIKQAGAGIGGGLIDYGRELEKRQGNAEMRSLSQGFADAEVAYAEALNGAKSSAEVGAARQAYEKSLAGLGENLMTDRGRDFFAEHSASARMRGAHEELVHTALIEGADAQHTLFQATQAADKLFALRPDEGGITSGLATLDRSWASLEGARGHLNAEQREKLDEAYQTHRAQFVQGAVYGVMLNNPAEGRRLAQKYAEQMRSSEAQAKLQEHSTRLERELQSQAWQAEEHDYIRRSHAADQAYDRWVQSASIDRATGRLTYSPEQIDAIRRDPGLAGKPGLRDRLMEQGARAEMGDKPENNPDVVSELQRSALLPDNDPSHLTIDKLNAVPLVGPGSVSPEVRKELSAMAQGAMFNADEKNEIGRAQGQLAQTNLDPLAVSRAQLDLREFVIQAKRRGEPVADALRQWDQKYSDEAKLKDKFGKAGVAQTMVEGAVAPQTQQQQLGARIATTAGEIADKLQRGASPEVVSDLLQRAGGKPIPPEDIRSGKWCADFVNGVLDVYGVPGAQRTAASFRTWGYPASAATVKPGDIAIAPPGEGATGHAMIVLRGPDADHPDKVQVASSHLMGAPSNTGGVEWRPAGNLVFRSYRGSIAAHFGAAEPEMESGAGMQEVPLAR